MRPVWSVLAVSVWLVARDTHAQARGDVAQRRAFIANAQAASDAGDHARALDLASSAAALGMSTSLRLFLTQEQEALGRWVDAYANANACISDAESDASLSNRDAIVAGCRELLDTARAHVAWLTVHLDASNGASPVVRVNGQAASLEALERAYPCEPGPTIVEASASGRITVRRDVMLRPGESVAITLAPLAFATAAASPVSASTNARFATHPVARRQHSLGPYVVAGGGAVGLVTAGLFFGLRQMAQGACVLEGRALVCATASDAARAQNAITYNAVADVALGVGLAALAAGTVWWIVDRRRNEGTAPHASIVPFPGGALATFEGRL